MRKNKKRILSALTVGAMLLSSFGAVFASDSSSSTPADMTVNDQYTEVADAAKKAETEALYQARPVTMRQLEYLDRGVVAVKNSEGTLVTWRMLGTDAADIGFNIYRDGTKLNSAPITTKTNYLDKGATAGTYKVVAVVDGQEVADDFGTATTWNKDYLAIPVEQHEAFYNDISLGFYDINDVSVGDLDGDGQYEYVVRRNPPSMDVGYRGENYPLIEAYKIDGTKLWTINIGPNEINDIDINFLVYDFNQDGKAEIVTRSFEGTTDGAGNQIGDVNGDGKTNYEYSIQKFPDRQYLSEGPEFLSAYDGMTGKEIARTDLLPVRDPLTDWASEYTDTARLTKRASHYVFTVAYLDGVTPSIVHTRGAWNTVKLAAWNLKDSGFEHLWTLDCGNTNQLDNLYNSGYHSGAVADIDFDGKDEILSGSFCVDHDGKFMYAANAKDANGTSVKLGHGDAFDVAKMDPDYNGYYVWACQENKNIPVNIGLHDARTGQVLVGYPKPKDTGRARAADIDPTNKGWECWGSTGTLLQSITGEALNPVWNAFPYRNADGTPVKNEDGTDMVGSLPMNFKIYWDGDLLSEFLDGVTVSKWNWKDQAVDIIFSDNECEPLLGTKAEPCLSADIFGDWREEVIFRTKDNTELRIYSTAIPTDYKMPTLMHDTIYRESVAWQNNHYNQPTNVSFYFGAETTQVPLPEIYTVKNGTKTINPAYVANPNEHAFMQILTEQKSNPVVLQLDNYKAIKDGATVTLDVAPILAEGDRTMVPLRFLSETFGAQVSWDDATNSATIVSGNDTIVMTIDSAEYTVNGEKKTLDVPAQLMNDRTMVPIRAVLESFGKQLYWNGDNNLIVIDDTMASPDDATVTEWVNNLK